MATNDDTATSIQVVRDFLIALDGSFIDMRDAFATRFSDDCEWENIGYPPVKGKEAVLSTLDEVHRTVRLDHTQMSIRHILGDEGLVLSEQVETNFYADGSPLGAPAMAMSAWTVRDGLITAWRDYFDPREFLELATEGATD